ncbi:hypothetical protein BS17DRAFT_783714 [Gyrodon lividus]|nr:hypothetical protein BS17DRAFT_783714 [Gyrodon lividus]
MATPSAPQRSPWLPDTTFSPPAYTRSLVGSELFTHRYSKLTAGGFDVCMGVKFHSLLSKAEIQVRARGALDKLRFHCPIIAASINDRAAWVYTPVQDDSDREAWLQRAFVFEDRGSSLDVDDFVSAMNQFGLPYEIDGISLLFRCYLLAGSESTHALVFHGSHSIMDAWPTLNALSLMFEWMLIDPPLEKPSWGSEWNNLPPDPVTAMGGPCATWDTDGVKLFQDIAANRSRQATCLTIGDDPQPKNLPGKPIRIRHRFTESESREIVAVAKQNECTVTHLLETAHCLALAACNPPNPGAGPAREVDFLAEMTIASLEPRLNKTHFISAFVHLPVRIPVTEILENNSVVQRMQLTTKALKEQYKYYLDNPCIYHLLVAQQSSPPPFQRPQFRTMLTSLGVTEKRLQTEWKGKGGETIFEIDELHLGNRMKTPIISLHSWSFKEALYVQVQACHTWKDAEGNDTIIRRLLDEMIRHIQLLLPNVTE